MTKFIIISTFLLLVIGCNNFEAKWESKDEVIISLYSDSKTKAKIIRQDDGAFGFSGTLKIQKLDKEIISEEIGLRADDYLPKIDSIKDYDVYISYNLPSKSNLELKDVALGEALIHSKNLLFKYHFTNTNK